MPKELIISANVHEKKVAIIEDGLVTEFYVERRDENQGVVGNLYKGRVMKVLPGMQSAFVDIDLERDAFLYVSDFAEFMEDEEAIDFKEMPEDRRPAPARQDERGRRGERPGREPAAAAPRAVVEEEAEEAPVSFEDAVEQLAEIMHENLIPPPPSDEELESGAAEAAREPAEARVVLVESGGAQEARPEVAFEKVTDEPVGEEQVAAAPAAVEEEKPRRGRGRRRAEEADTAKPPRRGRKKADEAGEAAPAAAAAVEEEATKAAKGAGGRASKRRGAKAAGKKEEVEPATVEEVATPFERITDDELQQEGDAGDLLKDAMMQEKIIEQIHEEEYKTAPLTPLPEPEPEPEWRVGSLRSQLAGDSGLQRVVDETAEPEPPAAAMPPVEAADEMAEAPPTPGEGETESVSEESVTPFRHISDVFSSLSDMAQARPGDEPGEAVGEEVEADETQESEAITQELHAPEGADELPAVAQAEQQAALELSPEPQPADEAAAEQPGEEVEGDREVRLRDASSRAEFAVRRGGRGRRRSSGRREATPALEDEKPAAADEAVEDDTPAPSAEPRERGKTAGPRERGKTAEPRGRVAESRGRAVESRGDRRGDGQRRPERPERPEPPPARRPERGVPTISELLHEGQEVLVQIAKEPIAKKGARITSHIALPGRYVVYMPTVNHVGVSRKIASEAERVRLKRIVTTLRDREGATGGFIARTACAGHTEQELHDDMRYLIRTWADVRRKADRSKAPALIHRDLDLVQRILRDQLSEEFTAIRVDNEVEYARIVEFVNRVQPRLVNRVKLYTGDHPVFEKYGVQAEIDKAVKPRVWLRSGGYIVINQTEALVAIDVNTGKFVGKSDKLEDTITRTNLEAAKEIVRQIRLRDLGGIIVIDFIDMEERKNRQRVMGALQQELQTDRSPSKILSINDFGLVAITRKRVKQSLERTLCTPCPYCQGAGMVKSAQTMCFELLEQAKAISRHTDDSSDVMLRVSPMVAEALRTSEREVFEEIEAYFGMPITIEADPNLHQEQYDFAVM